jgi:hypothetical protein
MTNRIARSSRFANVLWGLALLAAIALFHCGDSTLSPPVPETVEPAEGQITQPHDITIGGRNFFVKVSRNLSGDEFTTDDRFEVVLSQGSSGPVALENVTWVDTRILTATVPAGISIGTYRLTVTDPFGRQGSLEEAFTATDFPPCPSVVTCENPTPICNSDHRCVACSSHPECSDRDESAPYCDFETGSCFPCADSQDCGNPYPICREDPNQVKRCSPCEEDIECEARQDGFPVCDLLSGRCVECVYDTHCPEPGRPLCDPGTRLCVECYEETHCDDSDPCTDDVCDAFVCSNPDNQAPCDDGNECTDADACEGGLCREGNPVADLTSCQAGAGVCCQGTCQSGDCCQDTDCDDLAFCTGEEICALHLCTTGSGNPCTSLGMLCDEANDVCIECLEDGDCNDDVGCTDDTCVDHACVFTPNDANCPGDEVFCNGPEECKTPAGCVPNGEPCPDGGYCNEGTDTCDECRNNNDCDDGLYCTGTETCSGGVCIPGTGPCVGGPECADTCDEDNDTCDEPVGTGCTDDGDVCTDDQCDGSGNCDHPFNTAPCDDGLFCTADDLCAAGLCTGSGDACPGQLCDEGAEACLDFWQIDDPLGDSSAFSFVFAYAGRIWLGPRADGTGAVNMQTDGSDSANASFSFAQDTVGNDHRNSSPPPYPSIGTTDCSEDTPACGPDNEDGRGIFCSGIIGGDEWLVVAGARTGGDLDYVYMTRDSDPVLDFWYVDLSDSLGGATEGTSSMHVFDNRVFVGFPDTGGSRPYLVSINRVPSEPGLDAVDNEGAPCDPAVHDVCDLDAKDFPDVGGSADPSMIDSLTDFRSRLYLANNGGLVRSTTAHPLDYNEHNSHWAGITPSAPEYTSRESLTTDKTADIEPADKAVPRMVVFGNRLWFARNTIVGPQLWACTPDIQIDPPPATAEDCDPGDWNLVAPNSTGDPFLTQFDNPDNTHLTLLEADANHLYIGFDNAANGVVLFRTANPDAAGMQDFEGQAGCPADQHSSNCPGLYGNGFGDTSNSRFFSSVLSDQGPEDHLYIITGNGIDPVSLYIFGD